MKNNNILHFAITLIITFNVYSQKKIDADQFYSFTKNYALVKKGYKLHFIDTLGTIIPEMEVEQKIEDILSTDYGIQGNGLYISKDSQTNYQGIKNTKGEYVFEPHYRIKKYHNYFLLSPISKYGKKELIIANNNGKIVYKEHYKANIEIIPINNKLIALREKNFAGTHTPFKIKNIKTGESTKYIYSIIYPEINGLIKTFKYSEKEGTSKWGFMNSKLETVIDFIYTYKPGDLIDDRILVEARDHKYGYIDGTGKVVIEPKYLEAKNFVNGYAIVKAYKRKFLISDKTYNYGYRVIDRNGNEVIDLKNLEPATRLYYKKLNPIETNGIIRVKIKNRFLYTQALLDIKTQKITKTKYTKVYRFNSGLAVVKFKNNEGKTTYGYIDKKGKLVLEKELNNKF